MRGVVHMARALHALIEKRGGDTGVREPRRPTPTPLGPPLIRPYEPDDPDLADLLDAMYPTREEPHAPPRPEPHARTEDRP